MKNNENLLLGIFAGAAFGAIVGMLFSPHSGARNRRIIRRKGEDIAGEVAVAITEPIERFCDAMTEKIEVLRKEVLHRLS
jgi:gas vesicle protein